MTARIPQGYILFDDGSVPEDIDLYNTTITEKGVRMYDDDFEDEWTEDEMKALLHDLDDVADLDEDEWDDFDDYESEIEDDEEDEE